MSNRFMTLNEKFDLPKFMVSLIFQTTGRSAWLIGENLDSNNSEFSSSSSSENLTSMSNTSVQYIEENTKRQIEFPSEILIEPRNIGLIPASEWSPRPITLKQIHSSYFSKRNGTSRQFDVKLYNALCITKNNKCAAEHIGVTWVDSEHFKVQEKTFSNFIGILSENTNLFDKQGTLEKYGFVQVYRGNNPSFVKNCLCDDVDDCHTRLFKDPKRRFSREKSYAHVF